MLELKGVSKRYAGSELALDSVSFNVAAGEVVALIGPSGAGKSTLIRCINQLVEPTTGEIELNDTRLDQLKGRQLRMARRQIGMIFQNYALVERLSVMENVLSGRLAYVGFWQSLLRRYPADDIRYAIELLERVGLSAMMDKRSDALSGGQKQRVGIARALMQRPSLLLVDEPTASLDPKSSRQIMRLICELCQEQNLAAIINIHDVELARQFVSRVIGLQQGRVVFDGKPSELTESALTEIYGLEDWQEPVQHD
jgi:phosphonate transport system ATP-binding protein